MLSQENGTIEQSHSSLKEDFSCADEGEADGCLGIKTRNNDDKSLTLKQPQLIKGIIEIVGVKDANPKSRPVVKPLLSKNVEGKNRKIADCTMS